MKALTSYRTPQNNRVELIEMAHRFVGWITSLRPLDSTSNSVNDPPMSLATIRNEIEKLGPAERASLIDLLWDSLDDDRTHEIEAKWATESEDRIDAFERGELAAVDGPSALEELRSLLKK